MAQLDTPKAVARLQLSFVANIVLPLWLRMAELLPGLHEPLENLQVSKYLAPPSRIRGPGLVL